jgi:hypothetical protein
VGGPWPKKEAMWVASGKAIWVELCKLHAIDMEIQDLMFALLDFGSNLLCYSCIPLFWNRNVYFVPLYLGSMQVVSDFIMAHR